MKNNFFITDINIVKTTTKKAREEYKSKKEITEYSEKAIQAAELCKEFGCNKEKVRKLVSFLINEELPDLTKDKQKIRKLILGAVYKISPTNIRSKIGICVTANEEGEGLILFSNHTTEEFNSIELADNDLNVLSLATDKEIDEFFEKISQNL